MRIVPAELAFDAEGTPTSPVYGDVYHSAESGPGQAQHVFLAGNGLPGRWARARVFTIVETGFGLGLNFLATWRAWRADPERCERLHFVSIEKHPFDRDALAALHRRYGEFASLAEQLRDAWPPPVSGLHRLHFEDERLMLTVAFGDVNDLAPRLRLHADAFYLDGFSPRLNQDMWSPLLMRSLARLARQGATLATYSSAAPVRQALEAAGFNMEKCPGFGRKREMLRGSYQPRRAQAGQAVAGARSGRHAIVIGAGIAGAAICERLARRGWDIDLIEGRAPPAGQVPAKYAGVFHPHISRDDCILSRAARNGFLYAIQRWLALERSGLKLSWSCCGVLQLAGGPAQAQRMIAAVAAMGFPADFLQYLEREAAEQHAGCELGSGGWWYPGAGWMRPLSLIAAQLAAAGRGLRMHYGARVETIHHEGECWHALDAGGKRLAAAPVLVLANANDAVRLAHIAQPLQQTRGQVSYLPEAAMRAPRAVLTGSGYVLPAVDGVIVTGSTYDRDDSDPEPQARSHAENLHSLAQMMPHTVVQANAAELDGAVGFRCAAPDHLPLVGALPDVDAARAGKTALTGAQLADLPRRDGLYCASAYASRGLVWAALAGEMLASQLEGEPMPLEGDLIDALDPGRFVMKQARRGIL
ncbi:MAG: bifunctional tRNA (5-methylaminomethyl-2-thiouridine)(34)-methyltransferase MnmD/FAD-dependent 5-carboxymethylaminomethyl-2-thiouridine(34) oxidoreductase MnmC [Burkholderiales bacterium]|nr:bifunctional tRNA (5-methylaminomethyl-2-thiouridine)(34)-methyltransferase MnmD/FAD-dependent 5-carboxymethylaminomethyl-2-thiouridine(34) oxidoreductase MnmC [Burkholderiales bacterium]